VAGAPGSPGCGSSCGPEHAFSDLDSGAYTIIATGYPPRAATVPLSGTGIDDHDIELAHVAE
jgi:hypothetical protein